MIWDVIVIGAGPASAAFARKAAEGGVNILIIDGQTEKNRKPCGGLLAPDAQKLLAGSDFVLPKEVLADPQIFAVETSLALRTTFNLHQSYGANHKAVATQVIIV